MMAFELYVRWLPRKGEARRVVFTMRPWRNWQTRRIVIPATSCCAGSNPAGRNWKKRDFPGDRLYDCVNKTT